MAKKSKKKVTFEVNPKSLLGLMKSTIPDIVKFINWSDADSHLLSIDLLDYVDSKSNYYSSDLNEDLKVIWGGATFVKELEDELGRWLYVETYTVEQYSDEHFTLELIITLKRRLCGGVSLG
jgi:hypothetical protein